MTQGQMWSKSGCRWRVCLAPDVGAGSVWQLVAGSLLSRRC